MLMPLFILVLAVFIAPLPGLVSGTLGVPGYLDATLLLLVKTAFLFYVLVKLPGWLRGLGLGSLVDRLLLMLPVIGKLGLAQQSTVFYETLGRLLGAGVPVLAAVPAASGAVDNSVIRDSLKSVTVRLKTGATLTDALAANSWLGGESIDHLRAGEQAGRLDEAILHYSKLARERVTENTDLLATWLPRLFYVLVCIYMITAIFGSGALQPGVQAGLPIIPAAVC